MYTTQSPNQVAPSFWYDDEEPTVTTLTDQDIRERINTLTDLYVEAITRTEKRHYDREIKHLKAELQRRGIDPGS